MNHLPTGNIADLGLLDNDTATHVVIEVLYGADACFVFDREVASSETWIYLSDGWQSNNSLVRFMVNSSCHLTQPRLKML